MIKRTRTYLCAMALACVLACSSAILSGIGFGFSLGKPIFDDLQAAGVITGDQKALIFADVDDGIALVKTGNACIQAATGTKKEKQLAKARCVLKVAQDARSILARHHIDFIDNEKARRYIKIVEDVIVALETYFNQVTGTSDAVTAGTGKAADPDKELDRKLNDANKRMKALEKEK